VTVLGQAALRLPEAKAGGRPGPMRPRRLRRPPAHYWHVPPSLPESSATGAASSGGCLGLLPGMSVLDRVLRCAADRSTTQCDAPYDGWDRLCAALIDPQPSLNHSGEKIVAGSCTGKTVFMGFLTHSSATIGCDNDVRSEKTFFQPFTHRFIGPVHGLCRTSLERSRIRAMSEG